MFYFEISTLVYLVTFPPLDLFCTFLIVCPLLIIFTCSLLCSPSVCYIVCPHQSDSWGFSLFSDVFRNSTLLCPRLRANPWICCLFDLITWLWPLLVSTSCDPFISKCQHCVSVYIWVQLFRAFLSKKCDMFSVWSEEKITNPIQTATDTHPKQRIIQE